MNLLEESDRICIGLRKMANNGHSVKPIDYGRAVVEQIEPLLKDAAKALAYPEDNRFRLEVAERINEALGR